MRLLQLGMIAHQTPKIVLADLALPCLECGLDPSLLESTKSGAFAIEADGICCIESLIFLGAQLTLVLHEA